MKTNETIGTLSSYQSLTTSNSTQAENMKYNGYGIPQSHQMGGYNSLNSGSYAMCYNEDQIPSLNQIAQFQNYA